MSIFAYFQGIIWIVLIACSSLKLAANDQVPGAPQDHPIALVNGTIHTVSGPVLMQSTIIFDNGKIKFIGKDAEMPEGVEQIDVSGKYIYPGLIALNTRMGLLEIGAVRATRDYAEVGDITPEVRAEVAYNTDSEIIPTTRANGIAFAQSVPQGGLIAGTSALMALDGWTWENATVKAPLGLHINWPRMKIDDSVPDQKIRDEQLKKRDARLALIRDCFFTSRTYLAAKQAGTLTETSVRWEAMIPIVSGSAPVFVHADDIRDIQAALDWAITEKIRMILVGGYDAWRMASELKAHQVAVIYTRMFTRPERAWEGFDTPFTGPSRLLDAGVSFCVGNIGSSDIDQVRNLPYEAAKAVAYGLPHEEALKSLTLYPAMILGLEKQIGTLETGKDATMIVTTGDPLEITTRVEMMFIDGRRVDLSSRHTELYHKYREKYRQLNLLQKPAID